MYGHLYKKNDASDTHRRHRIYQPIICSTIFLVDVRLGNRRHVS